MLMFALSFVFVRNGLIMFEVLDSPLDIGFDWLV